MSMPATPDPQSKEPALKVGAIVGFVSAALAFAVAFGLKLTPDQSAALVALATFAAPLISAWFTRKQVFSPATVAQLLRKDSARP